jgi:hypothetical protein
MIKTCTIYAAVALILVNFSNSYAQVSLPENFPKLEITVSNDPSPGYFFFVPTVTNQGPGYTIIMDNYGTVIYYRYYSTFIGSLSQQPNGMLSYRHRNPTRLFHYLMDSSYNIVDSIEMSKYKIDAHDIIATKNGHYFIFGGDVRTVDMSALVEGGNPAASVTGTVIQELDESRNVVFEWNSFDHYKITDSYNDLKAAAVDYIHPNALEIDYDGNLLLEGRFMDELTKIDKTTGEIIWRFGGKNNQFTFPDSSQMPSFAHDARRLPNGHITMFDNGFRRNEKYSRAVEYAIDEVNKTAEIVWSYDAGKKVFAGTTGSTRRLDNGNTVIGYGFDVSSPAIVEVHPDSSLAFSLNYPPKYGSYRALKFPWKTNLIVPSVDSVRFAEWDGYTSETYLLKVKNNSAKPVTLTSYSTHTDAVTVDEDFPIVIPAEEQVTLTLSYYPENINGGYFRDVLTVNSDINSDTLVQRIALQVFIEGTKQDAISPSASFPISGAVQVPADTSFTLDFSEPVRLKDKREFDFLNIDSLISFTLGATDGPSVPFDGVINSAKTKVFINPKVPLEPSSTYYLSASGEFADYSGNMGTATLASFNTIDISPPSITIIPADGTTDVSPVAGLKIEFSEAVRLADNSALSATNILSLILFRKEGISPAEQGFTAEISPDNHIINILPDSPLAVNSDYSITVKKGFEDYFDNVADTAYSVFRTVISGVGVNILSNSPSIYPNPGSGRYTLRSADQDERIVRITDTRGKEIMNSEWKGGQLLRIDISAFPSGLYFVFLNDLQTGNLERIKLIKL